MIKIRENPDLLKDQKTNAVLNSNKKALEDHKARKQYFNNILERINIVEKRLSELEEKIK